MELATSKFFFWTYIASYIQLCSSNKYNNIIIGKQVHHVCVILAFESGTTAAIYMVPQHTVSSESNLNTPAVSANPRQSQVDSLLGRLLLHHTLLNVHQWGSRDCSGN